MTVILLDKYRYSRELGGRESSDGTTPRLITEPRIPWLSRIRARLEELTRLEPEWDGYQGRPVSYATAVFAMNILATACRGDSPSPDVMPGSGGDILIEWENGPRLVQVHVRAPNEVCIYRSDDAGGLEEEQTIRNDVSRLTEWLEWLARDGGDAEAAAEG